MKTLGLIGGTSWESTVVYYRELNVEVRRRLGGQHSSKLLLHSVDFEPVVQHQQAGRWDVLGREMADVAAKLEGAGAEAILLCANTMHILAPEIQNAIGIPVLHIADATGEALRDDGHTLVALLGTRYTMEQPFYRERLEKKFGIRALIPEDTDRTEVHRVIYEELTRGKFLEDSRKKYFAIVDRLKAQGATAVILGCTEIGLLLPPKSASLPMYDTAELHCRMAVDFQLKGTARGTQRGRSE